ncbi:hypothetical protein KC727_01915 [Candidatus Kaiserbacteria bacterium]|nr:hypothetical protein [Candidatus Kaiserbacteria bacterium]
MQQTKPGTGCVWWLCGTTLVSFLISFCLLVGIGRGHFEPILLALALTIYLNVFMPLEARGTLIRIATAEWMSQALVAVAAALLLGALWPTLFALFGANRWVFVATMGTLGALTYFLLREVRQAER